MRAIVEERDATPEQRAIREINAGVYVGDAAALRRTLAGLGSANDQGEQYLTDVLAMLVAEGAPVGGVAADGSGRRPGLQRPARARGPPAHCSTTACSTG